MKAGKKNGFLLCFFGPPPEAFEAEEHERSIGSSSSSEGSGELSPSEQDPKVIRGRRKLSWKKIIGSKGKSSVGRILPEPRPSIHPRKLPAVSDNTFDKDNCQKTTDEEDPKSGTISSSSSSPRSSSSTSSSLPMTPKTPTTAARFDGSAPGLLLLALSLSVMLFCGRVFAILWMSSWLCIVARRASDVRMAAAGDQPEKKHRSPATSRSRELDVFYKKKVVLEGFLERNRRN